MIVLSSTYHPIMERLVAKIEDVADMRAFVDDMPLADQISDIDVLMLGHQKITAKHLMRAPKLKLIQQHGRGIDGVDLPAARTAGVRVANVPAGNSIAVAEHCLALMLSQAKQLHLTDKAITERIVGAPCGLEISGKTLFIAGLGAAGSELARMARALGMRVLATKGRPEVQPDVDVDALGGPNDIHAFLPDADFVVLLAALTADTRNLIGANELRLMKSTAYLVNAARGALVDYDALFACLVDQRIAGAAFDTFWSEPADPSDPILELDRFTLTPHVAGFSDTAIEHVTDIVAHNIHSLANASPLLNVVNFG